MSADGMPFKMHQKTVRAIVKYMRSQKVDSFTLGSLTVKFSPEAFASDAPQHRYPHPLDPYASDDEHEEALREGQ